MLAASAPASVSGLCRLLPPVSLSPVRSRRREFGSGMRRWRNLRLRGNGAAPMQQEFEARPSDDDGGAQSLEENAVILCDSCKGSGWLLCDFCKGQKINIKSETNRIYRRCPSCKAAGYVLCQKCKVFKCVTFPDYEDGQM